jgi:hypothetical protein
MKIKRDIEEQKNKNSKTKKGVKKQKKRAIKPRNVPISKGIRARELGKALMSKGAKTI